MKEKILRALETYLLKVFVSVMTLAFSIQGKANEKPIVIGEASETELQQILGTEQLLNAQDVDEFSDYLSFKYGITNFTMDKFNELSTIENVREFKKQEQNKDNSSAIVSGPGCAC